MLPPPISRPELLHADARGDEGVVEIFLDAGADPKRGLRDFGAPAVFCAALTGRAADANGG